MKPSPLRSTTTGWVAGHAYTNSEPYAFLWTPTRASGTSERFPGGIESFALGVNDSGTVVGFSGAESGNSAFLWTQKGGMQNLGTLGGGSIEVSANGINNSGQVVGYAVLADNTTTHAFLWTQAGGMQDLGTLGGDYSAAYAINDAARVVGKSYYRVTLRSTMLFYGRRPVVCKTSVH